MLRVLIRGILRDGLFMDVVGYVCYMGLAVTRSNSGYLKWRVVS